MVYKLYSPIGDKEFNSVAELVYFLDSNNFFKNVKTKDGYASRIFFISRLCEIGSRDRLHFNSTANYGEITVECYKEDIYNLCLTEAEKGAILLALKKEQKECSGAEKTIQALLHKIEILQPIR